MTNRQQALMKGEFPASDEPITPRPDIEVEFIGNNTAVVRSLEHMGNWRIMDIVQAKRKGDWVFPVEWRNIIEEVDTVQTNPHQNNDGYWVWLLKKV